MANKNYTGTTRTLNLGDSAFRDIIFLPSKPPLDSELNFISDLPAGMMLEYTQAVHSSGFFDAVGIKTVGYDNTAETYAVNATDQPNTIIFTNLAGQPFLVNVLGDVFQVGGSTVNPSSQSVTPNTDPSKLQITLPPAASSRDDLVFLEMWYQQLISQSGNNEPALGQVYTYGNTQYTGTQVVPDDMYYASIGIPTTNRVQLQYQVRIVTNVNFVSRPDGVNDSATVFGQGSGANPSIYTFTQSSSDPGCYVSGDGSVSAQNALGSVDGYSYAIPLFRVHRRNTAPFSLVNQDGAGKSLLSGLSDRPDGLFYDKIEVSDIEDLRHVLTTDEPAQQLLEEGMNGLLEGTLNTFLTQSQFNSVFNGSGLEVDAMVTPPSSPGTAFVAIPNGQRRSVSDAQITQHTVQEFLTTQKTSGVQGGNWMTGDEITATVVASNPTGTVVGPRLPQVYATVQSGASQTKVLVPSSVSILFETAIVVTLTSIPSGVTNQDLWLDFDIIMGAGGGMNFVPTEMLQVYEVVNNRQFSFCSVNAMNGMRPTSLVTSGSASDILIGRSPKEAFTTLGYLAVAGNSTQSVTIGPNFGGAQINYIHAIYLNGSLVTRSTPTSIFSINLNGNGSFTVVFNNSIAPSSTLLFYVGLFSDGVSVQEVTKSIVETVQSVAITKTIPSGTNGGAGLNTVTIEAPGYVYGTQAEVTSASTFVDTCIVDGLVTPCTITFSGNFVTIQLTSAVGASSTDTVSVVVTYALALLPNQNLQMYYTYRPYSGITARQSFGSGSNSHITSKVVAKANGFLVHTSGTNGTNPTTPAQYAPILPKLPKANGNRDSDLNNAPLGAPVFFDKGIDVSTDFTVLGVMNNTIIDSANFWASFNSDTGVGPTFGTSTPTPATDARKLYDMDTVRFDKAGTNTALGTILKTPANPDWSSVIDINGNVLSGNELGFWYYIPTNTNVLNVSLILHTTGGTHHDFTVSNSPATPMLTGWNKAVFTARTGGNGTITAISTVEFQVNVNSATVTLFGCGFLGAYLETAGSTVQVNNQDTWFSQARQELTLFVQNQGMVDISDGLGFAFWQSNAYAFNVPLVGGTAASFSTKNLPYGLGKTNFLINTGNTNTRGTPNGSIFYGTGVNTVTFANKQAVMFLLEQVISDPTGNFATGEFMLRVETRILNGPGVYVSNADFDTGNSFDAFRLAGRPLGKL